MTGKVCLNGDTYHGFSFRLPLDIVVRIDHEHLVWAKSEEDLINAHSARRVSTYGYGLLYKVLHTAGVVGFSLDYDGKLTVAIRGGSYTARLREMQDEINEKIISFASANE